MRSRERHAGRRTGCWSLGRGSSRRGRRRQDHGRPELRLREVGERKRNENYPAGCRCDHAASSSGRFQSASAASLSSAVSSLRGASSRIVTSARRGPGSWTSSSRRTFPLESTTASRVRIIITLQTWMVPQSVPRPGAANAKYTAYEKRQSEPIEDARPAWVAATVREGPVGYRVARPWLTLAARVFGVNVHTRIQAPMRRGSPLTRSLPVRRRRGARAAGRSRGSAASGRGRAAPPRSWPGWR